MEGDFALFHYTPAGAPPGTKKEVRLPLPGEPYRVTRIEPTKAGRLIVATGIYGDVFLYDTKTNRIEKVGNPANRNVY